MRKLLQLTVLLFILLFSVMSFATESVTQTFTDLGNNQYLITFSVTAASNGSVTATATNVNIDGWVDFVVVDPGSTAPQADYDLTLTDGDSCDVMGAEINDLSATVSSQALPKIGSGYGSRYVSGVLTLNTSNNNVDSATFEVMIYFHRGKK